MWIAFDFGCSCYKHAKIIMHKILFFFGFTYLKLVKKLLGFKLKQNNCCKDLNL